ncbi:mitochondrial ribosomal protein L30 [Ptiloglossa arizonensis]|uniref:mitochondrial ribosomal protein L30 n=1 Tax=Ptiloglossa arizonensis TaxID=3350558 RepID=UPI003FA0BBE2
MANCRNVLLTFVRHRHYSKRWLEDAVRYDLIKYHPVKKTHVDPPIVPSKVFQVYRVKPFKGKPWWEKDILTQLGFKERVNDPVFVKNTPEMCKVLWQVKHLIKVIPLKIPERLPDINDLSNVYVHESGRYDNFGKLDPVRLEATLKAQSSVKKLSTATISEKLRLQWMKGNF